MPSVAGVAEGDASGTLCSPGSPLSSQMEQALLFPQMSQTLPPPQGSSLPLDGPCLLSSPHPWGLESLFPPRARQSWGGRLSSRGFLANTPLSLACDSEPRSGRPAPSLAPSLEPQPHPPAPPCFSPHPNRDRNLNCSQLKTQEKTASRKSAQARGWGGQAAPPCSPALPQT